VQRDSFEHLKPNKNMNLKELTLDELLTLRQNTTSVDEYRLINDEISRRYDNYYVMRKIEIS
jgi:hypothetical protein